MMRHLCYLIFAMLVNNLQQACSTHCYSCSSYDTGEACVKPAKGEILRGFCNQHALNVTEQNARKLDNELGQLFRLDIHFFDPQLPTSCLKQVLRVGDRDVVLRGCQLSAIEDKDICLKIQKMSGDKFQSIHCSLCNTDYCNVATYTTFSLVTLLLTLAVVNCL